MVAVVAALGILAGVSFPPAEEFETWVKKDGVHVERAEGSDEIHPWIQAHYEFPVGADVIEDYLCDFDRYAEWFAPGVIRADVLANGDDCTGRLHLVWNFPWPYKNRDGIVVYDVERTEDEFVLRWKGGAEDGDPKEGVRIKTIIGETRVKRLDDARSKVTYRYLGDLGGNFPNWLEEAAWKGEPAVYFSHLRQGMGLGKVGDAWPKDADAHARKRRE